MVYSETTFSIENTDFKFQVLETGELVISTEPEGFDTGKSIKFPISKETLRIIAIQLWEASKQDFEEKEKAVEFNSKKSDLTLSMKDKLIDEGLRSTRVRDFIDDKFEDVEASDTLEKVFDIFGKTASKVEERVNETAESEKVEDFKNEVKNIFEGLGSSKNDN